MNFERKATRRMMYRRFLVLVLLLASDWSVTTGYSGSFTALYAFGDSLTDTGRDPAPPSSYFNNRYSNGPLWVEYLSTNLGFAYNASNNFAVSGSTTSALLSQVAGLPASTNLKSGLFTVWSGGNDFLQNSGLGVNDPAWAAVVSNAVVNLTNAIGTLYTNGAREVIVGNLPDLGKAPFFSGTPAGYTNYISSKVVLFNSTLATAVTNLMQHESGLRIYLQDNYQLLGGILSAPAAYGLTVTSVGAVEDTNLTNKSFNGPGANYVFWDVIHPTTKVHALTAATAYRNVAVKLNVAHNGANLNLMVTNLYPGLPYTLQSSTNFTAWSSFQTFTATNTNSTLALTNGPGRAFFRVGY